ncbi:clotting factor B-like, partial [Stegodyphus dumicola]|uniref:clotting factor B-like n=1 Tax=Stegodyphus dumicola TaxID=202533 RepID=UPI0015B1D219
MEVFLTLILLGIFIFSSGINAQGSQEFEIASPEEKEEKAPEHFLRWNYTSKNCATPYGKNPCKDIRRCNQAVASLAIRGWPTVCGWVGKGVPKVCCGLPLVLGQQLMKQAEEEKARNIECGVIYISPGISKIENRFYDILRTLPEVDESNPNKFDPPLDINDVVERFLVGGAPTDQGRFPWMVSIRKEGVHWCGGSLIDRVHILSAAHCFVSKAEPYPDPNKYTVYVGNIYLSKGYPFSVQEIIVHESYQPQTHYYDIAILKLSKEILTPQIAHICLPPPEMATMDLSGHNTTILGWGSTEFGGKGTTVLHIVEDIPITSMQECKTIYSRTGRRSLPNGLSDDFICAGLPEGGKDACQ